MYQVNTFYKHSGSITGIGIILVAFIGLLAVTILGGIYGYAIFYIPFVYLNFFIVLGYGALVGLLLGKAGVLGNIRSPKFLFFAGFVFGILAEFTGWVAWIHAFSKQSLLLLNPADIMTILRIIAQKGAWSIFKWTPSGFMLYLIWFIEAIMIIGVCTFVAGQTVSSLPYCEECKKWLKEKTSIFPLQSVTQPEQVKTAISSGNFSDILGLRKESVGSSLYTHIDVTQCPGCRMLFLLTVKSVVIEKNSKGEEKKNEETLVENFIISSDTYHKLLALDKDMSSKDPEKTDS
jgi:hypothetical protein